MGLWLTTGLTLSTYYDDDEYMSVSAYKKFKKCEVDGMTKWAEPSTAMLIGMYVDCYVEGTLEQFKLDYPNIFKKDGTLKCDFIKAEEICRYIDEDKRIQQFLSGEKQTMMTGEIKGVPFKIKMDSYSKGIAINDLKIMRTVTNNDGEFYDFVTAWGYDIQLACYQEIVRQNTGEQLPCFIVAVTKETPINSVIIQIPQNYLDTALYNVEADIEHYYNIKMKKEQPIGCGKCKTCISKREKTPIISLEQLI